METKQMDNTGLGLIKKAIERVQNQTSLFASGLKKLVNMTEPQLAEFLNKKQIHFGRLLKVVSDIQLEATKSFKTREFFKTKDNGGIFAHVDGDIFNYFHDEVKDSPAKELASYEFTENITEENIVADAKSSNIYEEVDLAHIMQICKRHIIGGEKLLLEGGKANLFWIRNKKGELCEVGVGLGVGGWVVSTSPFDPSDGWGLGRRSFFRN